MSRCRKNKNMKKRRYASIRRMITMVSIVMIGVCIILFESAFASAHETSQDYAATHKYYKSIVVNAGDSMWTIAEQYLSEEYQSRQEYIKEVMEVNQMESSVIYADQKLIVPYYAKEYVASNR